MTAEEEINKRLEELAKAIPPDETLVKNVMSSIYARVIVESNSIERRYAISRLMKLAAAVAIVTAAAMSASVPFPVR